MSSQQFDPDLSETAQQINDLFDFAELSKAIRTSRLSRQRPLCAMSSHSIGNWIGDDLAPELPWTF